MGPMTDRLTAHFVDGSGAEVRIVFDERRVEMTAYDEPSRQRYALTFNQCVASQITYKELDDKWADRYNLTEGVEELPSRIGQGRRFQVGFADESVLEIDCLEFAIVPIVDGPYPDET
jgi:hypothetical protein